MGKIHHQLRKGAARVILCSALLSIPISANAQENNSRMLETGFEDEEGFRLFKYRTLKALNTLRDMGMTPQAIMETLSGVSSDHGSEITSAAESGFADAAGKVSAYTSEIGQDIADAVSEQTQSIVQDATDAATDAAKRQMNNWVDSLGESIGSAIRDTIDGVLGTSEE